MKSKTLEKQRDRARVQGLPPAPARMVAEPQALVPGQSSFPAPVPSPYSNT